MLTLIVICLVGVVLLFWNYVRYSTVPEVEVSEAAYVPEEERYVPLIDPVTHIPIDPKDMMKNRELSKKEKLLMDLDMVDEYGGPSDSVINGRKIFKEVMNIQLSADDFKPRPEPVVEFDKETMRKNPWLQDVIDEVSAEVFEERRRKEAVP